MKPVGVTVITRRVLEEIELVVFPCVGPRPSFRYLSNDLPPVRVEVFLLYFLGYPLGNIFLSGRVVKDGRAVL